MKTEEVSKTAHFESLQLKLINKNVKKAVSEVGK